MVVAALSDLEAVSPGRWRGEVGEGEGAEPSKSLLE